MEDELREMQCELNFLSSSDGSSFLSQGETSMLASISGPIEVKTQNLHIEKANVEVYYRSKSGISIGDRLKEQIIRNTCESALLTTLHPRTAIAIQLQEIEDRGGLIACAVNAACLSLLNSGISMKYLIGAVHCIIDKNNELIIDPNHRQLIDLNASFTFVFDSILYNIVTVYTTGKFTISQYNDALILCRDASKFIFKFYKEMIKKYSTVL